jgi:hypothetical protein
VKGKEEIEAKSSKQMAFLQWISEGDIKMSKRFLKFHQGNVIKDSKLDEHVRFRRGTRLLTVTTPI